MSIPPPIIFPAVGAVVAANSTAAAAASAAALHARMGACKGIVASFDSSHATVEQMRQYADCIQLLYPTSPTQGDLLLLRLLILLAGVGIIGGLVSAYRDHELGLIDWLWKPFVAGSLLPLVVFLLVLLGRGLLWVVRG